MAFKNQPLQTLSVSLVGQQAAGSVSLPVSAVLLGIIVRNLTANAVTGGLKFGTTAGATDVVAALAVGANALVHTPDAQLLKRAFSATAAQTIFVDAVTAWASAKVNIELLYVVPVF